MISLNWVKDYVDIESEDLKELAVKVTKAGVNVEQVISKHIDNLVIGEVKTCIAHPDSDHLHVCQVDVGGKNVQIVCGAPNVREGLKVIVALPGCILPGNFEIKAGKITKDKFVNITNNEEYKAILVSSRVLMDNRQFYIKEFDNNFYKGGFWGISVDDIDGLAHLEGESVQILADGAQQTNQKVLNGKISLELDAWKIIAGLGYQSYITTMPLEAGSQNGVAVGKRKRINELSLRVWRTLGCRVGSDLKNLQEVRYRNPQTPMGLPESLYTGIIPNIKYNQGWKWDANVTVEQSKPLPMNILAIAPIVTEVDK